MAGEDVQAGEVFEAERRRLFGLAYRLLGSVKTRGHSPPLRGAQAFIAGRPRRFPVAQAARVAARAAAARPRRWAGASAAEWITSLGLRGDAVMFIEAAIRVTTYVSDLDRLPASLAITQLRDSRKGVPTSTEAGHSSPAGCCPGRRRQARSCARTPGPSR